MGEHRWGPKFRCINGDCAIIQHASRQGWWRRGWGHSKWRNDPLPPCRGAALAADDRCTHVERIPLALNTEHAVRGGIKTGQCDRPALPRMVVCEHHATPDAVRIAMVQMEEEIARLVTTSRRALR